MTLAFIVPIAHGSRWSAPSLPSAPRFCAQAAQRNLASQLVAAQPGDASKQAKKKNDKKKKKKKKGNLRPPPSPFASHSAMDIKRYDSTSPTNFA